jgi:hypothetical protein
VSDLPDAVVPTATAPVSTATGFTFTISNYSNSSQNVCYADHHLVYRYILSIQIPGMSGNQIPTIYL